MVSLLRRSVCSGLWSRCCERSFFPRKQGLVWFWGWTGAPYMTSWSPCGPVRVRSCLDRCRCENRTVRRRTRPPCPCDPHFCFYFLFSILCLGLFYSFLIFNTFVMVNSNSPPNIHHRFLLMFFHITLSVRLFVSQFFSVFKAIILCGLCEWKYKTNRLYIHHTTEKQLKDQVNTYHPLR
jgi:hypothetical protein